MSPSMPPCHSFNSKHQPPSCRLHSPSTFIPSPLPNLHLQSLPLPLPQTLNMAAPAQTSDQLATHRPSLSTQPTLQPSPQALTMDDVQDACRKLSNSPMFSRVPTSDLQQLAKHMHKLSYVRGDHIVTQNDPADTLFILADGYARRLRVGTDGIERYVDTRACGATLSALHVVGGDEIYATAKCVTQTCSAYAMSRQAFRQELMKRPKMATDIIEGLSEEVRLKTRTFRTPLLSQRSHEVNYSAVCVAATVESYYRSALNAILNQRLSGIKSPLFPNMHIQVPARVGYIAGFKGLRALFDKNIDPDQWHSHYSRVAVRFGNMFAPGIVMTPVSSVLEACNVGHVNSEPIMLRATRGFMPRCGREVIFGVGLNQLSDYFEERYRNFAKNAVVANTAGSLTAGVVAGYFSHVPHNISTYKLLNPEKGYTELFAMFVDKSVPSWLVPSRIPESVLPYVRAGLACLFPRGVGVRTVQICGSFAILNGLVKTIEWDYRRKMNQAIESGDEDPAVASSVPE